MESSISLNLFLFKETCKDIAKRIWINSEVVVGARSKDIVAASSLSPIRRPAFPTGRIYQSLINSLEIEKPYNFKRKIHDSLLKK